MSDDPRRIVREGYDAVSLRYRADDERPPQYERWAAEAMARLPTRGRVLDLGCGCGVPLLRDLAAAGHRTTGVDASPVQSGFVVADEQVVPEGDGAHVAFWAQRPLS